MADIREPNDWRAGDLAYRWKNSGRCNQFGKIGSINHAEAATSESLLFHGQVIAAAKGEFARVLTPYEVARLPAGTVVAVLRGWRDYERGDVVELTSADSHWCGRAVNTRAKEMLLALIELPSSEDKIRAEKIEAATSRIEAAEAELERARRELEELA